ncbi:PDR/VanB family oxidoreductase [Paracoccus sp. Ld10]|uniref:PDR/VanB family oxidoreductase n=1 Tax=Paracoccus sp. Ld10 TaxID=649158 RepID=UPI00386A26F3
MAGLMLKITRIEPLSPLVTKFRLEDAGGNPLPLFSGGAHVVVEMPDGDVLRRNAYSLMSDPQDPSGYEIAVRRDDWGRGGSVFMHRNLAEGDTLRVSMPLNLFGLDLRARKHVLIAGGIGITPILAQMRQLLHLQARFELHYAARSRSEAAGLRLLPDLPQVHTHISDEGDRIDLTAILARQPVGTHVYTCGPERLITSVALAGEDLGWPPSALHSEVFQAPPPGSAFTVTLASSDRKVQVGPHQSLLEALEAASVPIDWSCRGGACGRCETEVTACDGRIEHNDHWLSGDERAAQTKIMPCVSRFCGEQLILNR